MGLFWRKSPLGEMATIAKSFNVKGAIEAMKIANDKLVPDQSSGRPDLAMHTLHGEGFMELAAPPQQLLQVCHSRPSLPPWSVVGRSTVLKQKFLWTNI